LKEQTKGTDGTQGHKYRHNNNNKNRNTETTRRKQLNRGRENKWKRQSQEHGATTESAGVHNKFKGLSQRNQ